MAKKPLTPKRRRFVAEYLKDQNGTQAAIRAGYSKRTARIQASDLLSKPDVQEAMKEKLSKIEAKVEISTEWILESLKEVALRCMQGHPVMIKDGNRLIESGMWEFDSAGANRALELLGKHRKLFTEKVEHSGTLNLEQILGGSWETPKITNGANNENNHHAS